MKTKIYLLVLSVAFGCIMCNSPKKEAKVTPETTTSDKKDEHKALSPADSLKLVNHQIEVKGDVEFPLQLTVDSLRKMKMTTIDNFKVVCQSGEVKKDNKIAKGVLLKDILEKAKIRQNAFIADAPDKNPTYFVLLAAKRLSFLPHRPAKIDLLLFVEPRQVQRQHDLLHPRPQS